MSFGKWMPVQWMRGVIWPQHLLLVNVEQLRMEERELGEHRFWSGQRVNRTAELPAIHSADTRALRGFSWNR